ncbi:Ccr4p-Not complex 3'-5'-exoribonuclease subunit Ccr4 [Trichomonascus vanleenenianus]|uniref:CCR4-Not complex 3'-5'-exoribonuclease subunit Ccr4 n=1 Tax=Trichomonascus vanleenenianus TaxID=2268995 RepID=UPI003ECA2E46
MIQPNSYQQRMQPQNGQDYFMQQMAGAPQPQAPQSGDGNVATPGQYASSQYWQQQVQLAQLSRQTNSPHNYARLAAMSSRNPGTAPSGMLTVTDLAIQLVQQQQAPSTASSAPGAMTPVKGSAAIVNGGGGGGGANFYSRQKREQEEEEQQRIINEDINKQFWTSIDLSGQGLGCITPKLFNYMFLQKLYLNHNKLVQVPASIRKLSQLKVLDLSDNQLTTLPAELGLLFTLRYLFLFDNKLTSLPSEFGYLFQLELLGIEGNPLPDATKKLLAEEGTRGVIIDLREKAPVKYSSPPRMWHVYSNKEGGSRQGGAINTDDTVLPEAIDHKDPNKFTLMSYNTLCDKYATAAMYGYTPSWALGWKYRSELLKTEILSFEADIVCLQEVDGNSYEQFWTPMMAERGYQSVFWPKTRARTMSEVESKKVDGCVTFYKTDKFKLIERHSLEYNSLSVRSDDTKTADIYNRVMTKDNIGIITIFEVQGGVNSGQLLTVANTHLHWDPAFRDVKLVQVALLLEELERILAKYASSSTPEGSKYSKYTDIKQIPLIVCGDFNSTSHSGVYRLFDEGKVRPDDKDLEGRELGRYTKNGMSHKFALKSSYSDVKSMRFTNYTPNFVEFIDHIWYSVPSFDVTGLLGPLDEEYASHYVGFPNPHHPSDHIPIMSQFSFKKVKEPQAKPPPPNFGNKK